MIKSRHIRESKPLRILLSLFLALIINILLLSLIHTLVSATRGAIADFEQLHMVEFVRLKPQSEPKEPPRDKLEPETEEKREPPAEPLEVLTQTYERQKPPERLARRSRSS